jgi:hypothetical protein
MTGAAVCATCMTLAGTAEGMRDEAAKQTRVVELGNSRGE